MTECPLFAHSGHSFCAAECPLLGVERTCAQHHAMSAFDPKRTLAGLELHPFRSTGVSAITSDLSAKLLGLFVQIIPSMRAIGLVTNSYNPNVAVQLRASQDAIRQLGLRSHVVEARTAEEFERGFASLKAANVDGVVLLADPIVVELGEKIAKLAMGAQLPTAFQRRENVEAGGLFSYGIILPDQFKSAAAYVDRILKGAKPADLPVEQRLSLIS